MSPSAPLSSWFCSGEPWGDSTQIWGLGRDLVSSGHHKCLLKPLPQILPPAGQVNPPWLDRASSVHRCVCIALANT